MKTATMPENAVEIAFDLDLLDLHQSDPGRYPYLLESAARGNGLGRYDILFAFPEDSLRLDASFELHGAAQSGQGTFLAAFDNWWARLKKPDAIDPACPFRGGWFLFLGYELAAEIEPRLGLLTDPGLPVAVATRIPVGLVRDHELSKAWIVAEPGYESALADVEQDIAGLSPGAANDGLLMADGGLIEEAPARFLDAVTATKKYITAGDIYQANISRQWTGRLAPGVDSSQLYRRLRDTNPAPFAGLAIFDDVSVISSSPERLLRLDGDKVETRPIAGTRPRDGDRRAGDDSSRREELLNHPKERAEHVMLIDLERNDLGRICKPGTVEVDQFMTVETYSHVHHIVSNISGRLLETATPGDAIRAIFPGGSITGCPKVRCMEIIRELENRPRGAYTGAMGYLNRDGGGDLNILIRTMTTIDRELSFATGSGIVADSDPEWELAETRAKAKGLLLAVDNNA
jgi:anthranilate synthase component 1